MTIKTRVTIVAPNLRKARTLDQIHVHRAGCTDLAGKNGDDEAADHDVDSRMDVASFICGLAGWRFYNGPAAFELLDAYLRASLDEIHFAPCLKDLPRVEDHPHVSASEFLRRHKKLPLTQLTPEERATYDSYKARLATADMQVNQSDFGLMYADAVAAYDALQGEFENWADGTGLLQEER